MQVSKTLQILEKKKLIARRRSSSDPRAKELEVTQSGLEILRQALPIMIDVQGRLFGEAGRPGGSLLITLLRLEKLQVSEMTE